MYLPVSESMPTRNSYIGRKAHRSVLPVNLTSFDSRPGGETAMMTRCTPGLAAASLAAACGAVGAGLAASVLGADGAAGGLVGAAAGAVQAAVSNSATPSCMSLGTFQCMAELG